MIEDENYSVSLLTNKRLSITYFSLTLIFQVGLLISFGLVMVPFLLVHNLFAWWQLTSANYIEHYGLLREKLSNGRYELCKPYHSWNSNYLVGNLHLFNLQRHSDHHANPGRRYQVLRNFDDLGAQKSPKPYIYNDSDDFESSNSSQTLCI